MEYKKKLGWGMEGITYLTDDETCVKVYCGEPITPQKVTEIFQRDSHLAAAGIKVPKPLEIVEVNLNSNDWPVGARMGNLIRGRKTNGTYLAIKKEYIPGKPLNGRLFSSRTLSDKIIKLDHSIRQAGYLPQDMALKNMIETSEGEVYMIDTTEFIQPYGGVPQAVETTRVPTSMLGECLDNVLTTF
jgi:hypothetical protein